MNIGFMAGLNLKGPASKNPVDSGTVPQGRDCKRGNKTQGFLQALEKSKQGIKSDNFKNAGNRPGKNESDSVVKTRPTERTEVPKPVVEDHDSTELNGANGELPEQFNSQLLLELADLLRTIGITLGETNSSPDDAQMQNFPGQPGAQPEALAAGQQKAHIMQLLQIVRKLTGEMNGRGDAGFEAVLQNLLTMTDAQLTDGNNPIDPRLIARIVETLKKDLMSFKQETPINTMNINAANMGDITEGIPSEKKTGDAEKVQNGAAVSGLSGKAAETGKQPLSVDSAETKEQIAADSVVRTRQNVSDQSNSSEQSGSGLPKRDVPGKNVNVTNLDERTTAQQFELEPHVYGSGMDTQNPSSLEQSSDTVKITRNIFGQIAQKAKLMVAPGVTEMQIQLKPEVLGKLNLTISSENGMVTAKFNAESHTVKAIIEANLSSLKDALTQQGVKVDQLVVDVGTQSHQQGFERRNSYYSGSAAGKNGAVLVNSEDVEKLFSRDANAGAVNAYYGSTVEFTA